MFKTATAIALTLMAGTALADCYEQPAAAAPVTVYPQTSAAPQLAPAIATPPPQVVVITPAPSNPRPMMSDDAKFSTLDTSSNGSLDRGEVAANSELVTRFSALDKNNDGKLSRKEYGMRNVDPMNGR